MFTKRIGVLAGLMVIGFSCSKALQNQIPPPNGEVTTAGPLSLDEREISAEVHGSQMLVGVPLRNIGQESISGSLFISVLGLQNDFKALGAQSFDIKTGSEVVLVTIPQVPPDLQDEGHDALYVIAYDVFSTVGTIKGKRSLFRRTNKGQTHCHRPKDRQTTCKPGSSPFCKHWRPEKDIQRNDRCLWICHIRGRCGRQCEHNARSNSGRDESEGHKGCKGRKAVEGACNDR